MSTKNSKEKEIAVALVKLLSTKKGRCLMLIHTMMAGRGWTDDQITKLQHSVEAVAEAFGVGAEDLLHAIGGVKYKKNKNH